MTESTTMTWREYLSTDTITSGRQATAQRLYWGTRSFFSSPLAVFGLVVILLLAILYIAFLRFRNPPAPTPTPVPAAAVAAPHGVFGWSEILPHGGQTSRAAPPQAASADV